MLPPICTTSGCQPAASRSDFPMFFHYVNAGPDIRDAGMITDVYLPLR